MYIRLFDQCEPSSKGGLVFGHNQKDVTYSKIRYPKKVKIMVFYNGVLA